MAHRSEELTLESVRLFGRLFCHHQLGCCLLELARAVGNAPLNAGIRCIHCLAVADARFQRVLHGSRRNMAKPREHRKDGRWEKHVRHGFNRAKVDGSNHRASDGCKEIARNTVRRPENAEAGRFQE